ACHVGPAILVRERTRGARPPADERGAARFPRRVVLGPPAVVRAVSRHRSGAGRRERASAETGSALSRQPADPRFRVSRRGTAAGGDQTRAGRAAAGVAWRGDPYFAFAAAL